jgi:uncharacterized protein
MNFKNCKIINYKLFVLLLFLITFSAFVFAVLPSGEIHIFAVTEDEEGMAADLLLYNLSGSGEVAFITSNSLVGKDTQTTGNIALDLAQKKTGVNISNLNFIYDIKANASEVDGPSAGAAMALLSYSLLSEKTLSDKVGLTGTINSDGSVGAVGGVGPKAVVASDIGIELFLVPSGQAVTQIIKDGKAKTINLLEYGPKELGIKVVEVATLDDVIKYAYSDISTISVDPETSSSTFIPEAIFYSKILGPMKEISNGYIERAHLIIKRAEKELEITDLDESIRISLLIDLQNSKREVELAEIYLDQNYLYSAANSAFNATIIAETIEMIAVSPSILNEDSKIFDLKVVDINKELNEVKKEMVFIPVDKFEWMVGAQQRLAYAENSISSLGKVEKESDEDELKIKVANIREIASAKQWIEVAKDFLNEAKTSSILKKVNYDEEFILSTKAKIQTINVLINDANLLGETKAESIRRLESAKLSFNNGFYYAALFDAFFAQSFLNSEIKRSNLSAGEIETEVLEKERELEFNSIWANIYFDHAKFFIETANSEQVLGREQLKEEAYNRAYDLITLSEKIEEASKIIENDIASSDLENYIIQNNNGNEVNEVESNVEIEYVPSPLLKIFSALSLFLLCLLLLLVFLGLKSSRKREVQDFVRAEKVDKMLNKLDKAMAKGSISHAEYFFLKKKYDEEFRLVSTSRQERSKIALNLDESKAKLSALQKGLKDLKKHYKSGLILPEDYERHLSESNEEIREIKEKIKNYEFDLEKSRGLTRRNIMNIKKQKSKKSVSEFDVDGTGEKEKKQKEKEKEEKEKRKKFLDEYKKSKKKN